MKPLPQTKISVLRPVLETAIKELGIEDRTTVDFLINRIGMGYTARSINAYVDDVEEPKHVLVLEHSHGGVTDEKMVEVRFIYSEESERGDAEAVKAFDEQITTFCEFFNPDVILGSSWVYRGARRIDALWTSLGFEKQEIVYIKRLNTDG